MANSTLFEKSGTRRTAVANTQNSAKGAAYQMNPRHALAQFVATSCLNGTFYATASQQLTEILTLLDEINDPQYVAKLALYGHSKSKMRDLPVLLCAWLAKHDVKLLVRIWDQVIDSGNMLRTFAQFIRSGIVGSKSFGTRSKLLVRRWFDQRTGSQIFNNSIGNNPTLGQVIKMTHAKPKDAETAALFAYLCGAATETVEGQKVLSTYYIDRETNEKKLEYRHAFDSLPAIVKEFEAWKADKTLPVPQINFRFVDNEKLTTEQWREVALSAKWDAVRNSLNTYSRHGVYDEKTTPLIAEKLRDRESIKKARAFPYAIMMAYLATTRNVYGRREEAIPREITNALQDAMEIATENVPSFDGQVYVCPDVSGSMVTGRITGNRDAATTAVRCIDVAALITATILRTNKQTEVIPFGAQVMDVHVNPRDTVMTNAERLAAANGGGTNCSAPLAYLNRKDAKGNIVIFVSDYESWVDTPHEYRRGYLGRYSDPVAMMREWNIYKERNPQAKLICIDLTPRGNTQVQEHEDILQVGGWSDSVYDVIGRFLQGGWSKNHWVKEIESTIIPE